MIIIITKNNNDDNDDNNVNVAPHASTAKERFNEWSYKFGKVMGFKVAELVGDLHSAKGDAVEIGCSDLHAVIY